MKKLKNIKDIRIILIILATIIVAILFLPFEKIDASNYNFKTIDDMIKAGTGSIGKTITITEDELKSSANQSAYCIVTSKYGHSEQSVTTYIRIEGTEATIYVKKNGKILSDTLDAKDNAKLAFIIGGTYKVNGTDLKRGFGNSALHSDINVRQIALWRNVEKLSLFNTKFEKLGITELYNWDSLNNDGYSNNKWKNYGSEFMAAANEYANSLGNLDNNKASIDKQKTTITSTSLSNGSEKLGPFKFTYNGTLTMAITDAENKTISSSKIKYQDSKGNNITSIESGKEFYIINSSGKSIKNVKASVKLTIKGAINVDIFMLEASKTQPVIVTDYEQEDIVTEDSIDYEINIGQITIVKKDGNIDKALANAKITLQDSANNYYDKNGNNKGNTKTEITIPATGITIKNLPAGTYKISEVAAPDGYDLKLQTSEDITATANLSISNGYKKSINIKNYQYGDLQIIKEDEENKDLINGVKFIIKNSSGYISSYTAGSPATIEYTNNKEQAYRFTTNGNGEINLSNIPVGKYKIYEVEGAEGYDIKYQDNYDSKNEWIDCGEVNVETNTSNSPSIVRATNAKIINISGYVWLESPGTKDNDYNSLYNSSESRVSGVKVNLKNKSTGEIVATTTTNENGEYVFEKVSKAHLKDLYVEFDYSNTEYKSCIPVAFNNTSKEGSRALYEVISEKDTELTGVVSTYKGTEKETEYGLSGKLLTNFYNKDNYTLENINLGIKQLPKTSYTLQETIAEVNLKLGNLNYKYIYGGKGKIISDLVPTVNWKDGKACSPDIYPSDIAYAIKEDKPISATIEYRIDITNTTNLSIEELYVEKKLHVSGLKNIFDDNRYELADSNWLASGNTATITNDYLKEIFGRGLGTSDDLSSDDYKTGTAFIKFNIKEDAIKQILKNPEGISEENPTKAISQAYHEYTRKDYSWNNDIAKEQTHYTDIAEEEDSAEYLLFKLGKQRAMSGVVFEDNNEATNGEVLGNGRYDGGENKLEGIKVDLLNEDGSIANVYKVKAGITSNNYEEYTENTPASTTTDENGNYNFIGILPETPYYIRFTYGNGTQKIADYKSTIVTSEVAKSALGYETNTYGNLWYRHIEETNYSVAVDDLGLREKYNTDKSITEMEAKTPLISMPIDASSQNTNTIKDSSGIEVECYTFDVFNFGIIKMPTQKLDIEKNITNVKVTNTQGNIVLDGDPYIDVMAGVTTINSNGNAKGYVRIELPEDEIYGSELTITYEIVITNNSELDYYENEGSTHYGWYYKFGYKDSETKEATIKANEVIDYLDPSLTYVSSNPKEQVQEIVYNASNSKWVTESGEIVEDQNKIIQLVAEQEQYMKDVHTREDKYASILSITDWEELYSTRTTKTSVDTQDVVEIVAKRSLSTDDNDMEFISTAEIITAEPVVSSLVGKEIDKPGKVYATTSITPPTGADLQTIAVYTITITVSLILLAVGVVIIKKKVLK